MVAQDEWHDGIWPLSKRNGRFDGLQGLIGKAESLSGSLEFRGFPPSEGSATRGEHLLSNRLFFADVAIEVPNGDLWQTRNPPPDLAQMLHGFTWLDDLAACNAHGSIEFAQRNVQSWMNRFGESLDKPCWLPETAGRRLIRWSHNGSLLMALRSRHDRELLAQAIARHGGILARRWHCAPRGLHRAEALCGLIYAHKLLGVAPSKAVVSALNRSSDSLAVQSRSPESLLRVALVLRWAADALAASGGTVSDEFERHYEAAIDTLSSLRHADGSLPRMHGGDSPPCNSLPRLLAPANDRKRSGDAMGFVRLSQMDTSLVVDAAPPPVGKRSLDAHASALAFEMVCGKSRIIVGRGAGRGRHPHLRSMARQTRSHSVLEIGQESSARFTGKGATAARSRQGIARAPRVIVERRPTTGRLDFAARHDGYLTRFGVEHRRMLSLQAGGSVVKGQDVLAVGATIPGYLSLARRDRSVPVEFALRFHLHPEAEVTPGRPGTSILIGLGDEQTWEFSFSGKASLSLEESDYLDENTHLTQPNWQIVLTEELNPRRHVAVEWSLERL